jgi:hypothetical protein
MALSGPAANQPPGTPTIKLADVEYPVPKLALRQNIALQPLFNRVGGKILEGNIRVADLTAEDVSDLAEIAYLALSRAHPTVTREDLQDLPIGVSDLVGVLLTVMEQSNLFKRASEPGEAQGEASPQTGTP